jgi:hypothetical protein
LKIEPSIKDAYDDARKEEKEFCPSASGNPSGIPGLSQVFRNLNKL